MGIHSHIQLPNLILQHFRDDTDPEGKVWYLDISSGKILRKPAKRLGTSKGYYSKSVEEFWDKRIEDPLGKLNQRVRAFCSGKVEKLTLYPKDMTTARQYIKAAAIRSNLAYETMRNKSVTAPFLSEQENHDALSVFGMDIKGSFDQLFDDLSVTVIANRTSRHLVVPRNCYYCVSRWGVRNFVVPISPQSAFLLLPAEHLHLVNDGYAVIDDPAQIDAMNVLALKYEYMFNADFVASDRRTELELLQQFQTENLAALKALTDLP